MILNYWEDGSAGTGETATRRKENGTCGWKVWYMRIKVLRKFLTFLFPYYGHPAGRES